MTGTWVVIGTTMELYAVIAGSAAAPMYGELVTGNTGPK